MWNDIVPNMGQHIETILEYGTDYMAIYSDTLWVIAGFSLGVIVIIWVLKTIQNPPRLDI